jgi:UDP-N-acetylglucosamine:LPS N-acetylglucosamine transferase
MESDHTRVIWITFKKTDATSLLAGRFVLGAFYPTNRNLTNLFRNLIIAINILRRLKPICMVSTGAGVAISFFLAARLFGVPALFIESFARTESPSWSGRVCYYLAKRFIYQWKPLERFYPKGIMGGSIY